MTYQDQDATTPVSSQESSGSAVLPGNAVFRSPVNHADPPEALLEVESPPRKTVSPRRRWFQPWAYFWLVLFLASSGSVVGAFIWLTALPPVPNCQNPSSIVEESERLACAQQATASGELKDLVAGVKLVQNWPKDNPRYRASQRLLANWSSAILLLARQQASQNKLREAITTAQNIPKTSVVYSEAREAIASWQQELDRGQVIYNRAQAAFKAQDWRRAREEILALSRLPNPLWRSRVVSLRQQLQAERVSRDRLREARTLAQAGDPASLAQAINLAQTINRERSARPEAQAEIGRWSRVLLNLATAQFEQREFAAARSLAERIPEKSALGDEARAFVQLARAQEIVTLPAADPLNVEDQWATLLAAVQTARTLPADAPLKPLVKEALPRWQDSLNDLHQLQLANSFAQTGQIATLQLAINQANRIAANRPRRVQAQTLVSHWRKEVQRLQDRPQLDEAIAAARAGTPDALRTAIGQARRIARGRALRPEAQAAIARWNRQLQQLEGGPTRDRQILTEAAALAEWGNLITAIEQARQIKPGSPVYAEAQAAIARWQGQLAKTQSRPSAPESR